MVASWNVAKLSSVTFFSLPPSPPPPNSFSFGLDLERGVCGKLDSKTDSYSSNHWVFSLSLVPLHWVSSYPFITPSVGFSKYVHKQPEIQLEPGSLVKSCWIVIRWLYWSPSLPHTLGWLYFWVSTAFLSHLLSLRQRTCQASFWSNSIDMGVASSLGWVFYSPLFLFVLKCFQKLPY